METLPAAFARYSKVGGVLEFAAFDDAEDSDDEAITAIRAALGEPSDFDAEALRAIGNRDLFRADFLGDRCDLASRKLIRRGTWRTTDGKELVDPPLVTLDKIRISTGGVGMPLPGDGGDFARAFAEPPYGLKAQPSEVQALFDEIHDFLLPRRELHLIRDWASPRLPEVSCYFRHGMEWWGVFHFTIYQPLRRRVIAIAGSTTN
ncbi:hypothetical protein [Sphingomonas sp.]|uniref:hypothetical protein n=1 Tax=Sphingomonas sp. TaxID=28214 RepID=UPI002ED86A85